MFGKLSVETEPRASREVNFTRRKYPERSQQFYFCIIKAGIYKVKMETRDSRGMQGGKEFGQEDWEEEAAATEQVKQVKQGV